MYCILHAAALTEKARSRSTVHSVEHSFSRSPKSVTVVGRDLVFTHLVGGSALLVDIATSPK